MIDPMTEPKTIEPELDEKTNKILEEHSKLLDNLLENAGPIKCVSDLTDDPQARLDREDEQEFFNDINEL